MSATDLQHRLNQLTAALTEQTEARWRVEKAYDELVDQEQHRDGLAQELVRANLLLAQEGARATALDLEADLYRDRYQRSLQRIAAVSQDVRIANAARGYLTAIERRGSLEDDVVAALVHMADQIRSAPGHTTADPERDLVLELEAELEALRIRIAELIGERDDVTGQRDELDGQAAEWQELAETNDRQLVEAQKKIIMLEQFPSEARHALGHVVECDDNCQMCRDLAADTLQRTFGAPYSNDATKEKPGMGEHEEMSERDSLAVKRALSRGTISSLTTDGTYGVIAEDPVLSEVESWRLTALAMEMSRDDAVEMNEKLIDVAAVAAVLPCILEEGRDPTKEIAMLKEALDRYLKARLA
jgi:hypothetical protein